MLGLTGMLTLPRLIVGILEERKGSLAEKLLGRFDTSPGGR